MVVGVAYVFPGFLKIALTQISFQSHRYFFHMLQQRWEVKIFQKEIWPQPACDNGVPFTSTWHHTLLEELTYFAAQIFNPKNCQAPVAHLEAQRTWEQQVAGLDLGLANILFMDKWKSLRLESPLSIVSMMAILGGSLWLRKNIVRRTGKKNCKKAWIGAQAAAIWLK